MSCLGLKDVPQDEWHCPACRCMICDHASFDPDSVPLVGKKADVSCHSYTAQTLNPNKLHAALADGDAVNTDTGDAALITSNTSGVTSPLHLTINAPPAAVMDIPAAIAPAPCPAHDTTVHHTRGDAQLAAGTHSEGADASVAAPQSRPRGPLPPGAGLVARTAANANDPLENMQLLDDKLKGGKTGNNDDHADGDQSATAMDIDNKEAATCIGKEHAAPSLSPVDDTGVPGDRAVMHVDGTPRWAHYGCLSAALRQRVEAVSGGERIEEENASRTMENKHQHADRAVDGLLQTVLAQYAAQGIISLDQILSIHVINQDEAINKVVRHHKDTKNDALVKMERIDNADTHNNNNNNDYDNDCPGLSLPLYFQIIRGAAVADTPHGGPSPAYETRHKEELRKALSAALLIAQQTYEPLVDSRTGADILPWLIRGARYGFADFSGTYTAVLYCGTTIVSMACVRALRDTIVEIPVMATRMELQRQGLGERLLAALERILFLRGGASMIFTPAYMYPTIPFSLSFFQAGHALPQPMQQRRWGYALATHRDMKDILVTCRPLWIPGVAYAVKKLDRTTKGSSEETPGTILMPRALPSELGLALDAATTREMSKKGYVTIGQSGGVRGGVSKKNASHKNDPGTLMVSHAVDDGNNGVDVFIQEMDGNLAVGSTYGLDGSVVDDKEMLPLNE